MSETFLVQKRIFRDRLELIPCCTAYTSTAAIVFSPFVTTIRRTVVLSLSILESEGELRINKWTQNLRLSTR